MSITGFSATAPELSTNHPSVLTRVVHRVQAAGYSTLEHQSAGYPQEGRSFIEFHYFHKQ
jgi:hypothetical protein